MRSFIAVEVSDNHVLNSIKKFQSEFEIGAKPIQANQIHFTLFFLGDVSDSMAEKIKEKLASIKFSSFEIGFSGVGAFPKSSFPRVIWVGLNKGADQLVTLANKVQESLSPLGFTSDKPFKPHVTIFRVKDRVNLSDRLLQYSSTEFGDQKVNEIKFKQSVLTPQGPIYSDIQVVKAKQ